MCMYVCIYVYTYVYIYIYSFYSLSIRRYLNCIWKIWSLRIETLIKGFELRWSTWFNFFIPDFISYILFHSLCNESVIFVEYYMLSENRVYFHSMYASWLSQRKILISKNDICGNFLHFALDPHPANYLQIFNSGDWSQN